MKIAVIGSRDFLNYKLLCDNLDSIKIPITEIVSGGANGADALAERYASERSIRLTVMKANWKTGRHAGMVRNTAVVDYSDKVIAFWDGQSKGTADTIEKSRKCGKLYKIVLFGGWCD